MKKIPMVCEPAAVQFHFSKRIRSSIKKSKHHVHKSFDAVKKVLRLNPDYGTPIPKFSHLRKMRIHLPHMNMGKSGGYRLIYRKVVLEEVIRILFLETYFKGDQEDLPHDAYQTLLNDSETVLNDSLSYDWEE